MPIKGADNMYKTKIDSKFQIKFPVEIIKKINLQAGDSLEIGVTKNHDIVLHKISPNILDQTFGILGPVPTGIKEVDFIRDEEESRLKELSIV